MLWVCRRLRLLASEGVQGFCFFSWCGGGVPRGFGLRVVVVFFVRGFNVLVF